MNLADRIKDRANLEAFVTNSGVALERKGRRLVGLCPFHIEKTGSFTVDTQKRPHRYKCWGCGRNGTVIDFVMERRGLDSAEAIRDLASELGLSDEAPDPERAAKDRKLRDELAARQREDERRRVERMRANASEVWRGAAHDARAGQYYAGRGVDVAAIARAFPSAAPGGVPLSLRLHPACPDFESRRFDPAIVGAITRPVHDVPQLHAVHRTFLNREMTGKRAFDAKKMLGAAKDGVVRLTPPARCLILAEGIETAMSLLSALALDGIARGGIAVFAGLSLGNIAGEGWGETPDRTHRGIILPPATREVVIAEDADNKDPESAGRLYARAAARWGHQGLRVRRARPHDGMDFNDMLRRAA